MQRKTYRLFSVSRGNPVELMETSHLSTFIGALKFEAFMSGVRAWPSRVIIRNYYWEIENDSDPSVEERELLSFTSDTCFDDGYASAQVSDLEKHERYYYGKIQNSD